MSRRAMFMVFGSGDLKGIFESSHFWIHVKHINTMIVYELREYVLHL